LNVSFLSAKRKNLGQAYPYRGYESPLSKGLSMTPPPETTELEEGKVNLHSSRFLIFDGTVILVQVLEDSTSQPPNKISRLSSELGKMIIYLLYFEKCY
jgi:hypothetical protein